MKNIKTEFEVRKIKRPTRPRYHEGGAHLHDTKHEGGAHLHDTRHEGGAHLHDTKHEGGAHLHDTKHEGGAHLHDTQHIPVLLGKEHGNTHIVKGSVAIEKDREEGMKMDYHNNYSFLIENERDHIGANDSYFYRGFRDYPQRGYLKFTPEENADSIENHIVFINDNRHQTVRGEENRRIYFRIRKVPLVIAQNTVEIFVASNFDVVPHCPQFPERREWKNDKSGYVSEKVAIETDEKITLHELSHKDFDTSQSSNTVTAEHIYQTPKRKEKNFHRIKLDEEINTPYGYLKLRDSDTAKTSLKSDIILFVSERPRIRKNRKIEFELKTVPLIIADNTVEMDVAFIEEKSILLRFILWIIRGLKRVFPAL